MPMLILLWVTGEEGESGERGRGWGWMEKKTERRGRGEQESKRGGKR